MFTLFAFIANAQYLRGDFNSWGTDYLMTEYYGYYYATLDVTVDVTDGLFKVDQTGDWSLQWGYATDSYNPIVNTSEGQMRGSNSGDSPSNFTKTLTANKFYTFRLEGTDTWWNRKFIIMETDAEPVSIIAVSDNNVTVGTGIVTVSIETSAALSAQETVYVRYTNDSWASSNIVACTGSGTDFTAEIPSFAAGTDIEYYAFSSTMVLSFVSTYTDFATLNGNNNAGANYTYTVTSLSAYAMASVVADLSETNLDNAEIDIELFNDTFADASFDLANFVLNNAPIGLTVLNVVYTDANNITLVLDFDGTDFSANISNFSISISADELAGSEILTTNNLTIYEYVQTEGFDAAMMVMWEGGADDIYYNDFNFNGHDFGVLNNSNSLYFKSTQAFVWKITGGDIASATMNYRMFKQGETPGAFIQQSLLWDSENVSNDTTYQLWWDNSPDEFNLNLLEGLTAGQYYIETYFEMENASADIYYKNNGGLNYIAEFTFEEIPLLTASTQIEMNSSNLDGMEVDLFIANDSFVDDSPEITSYSLYNAPFGLSISNVIYFAPDHVKVVLAYSGGLIPTQIDDFAIYVDGSEFTSGQNILSIYLTIYADVISEGIYRSKLSFWPGTGSDVWFNEEDFNGHDFGAFNSSMSLYFKSGQVFTWKNTAGNISSAALNYRIYKDGETPDAFIQVDLPFYSEWASGTNTDQLWWNDSPDEIDINLLNAILPGTYFIEVYFEAENGSGQKYYSNNEGANYIAEFTFTDNPILFATPAAAITEENLDGMLITLDLNEDVFADGILNSSNFSLNNVPVGVGISEINYVGPTKAILTLAFDGTDFDSDSTNFSITISEVELLAAMNLTSNKMLITAIDESATIYTHLLTNEDFIRYQGDSQSLWINMEIGQTEWNGAQIGIGTVSANPASFTWYNAEWYEDGDVPNKRVHSQITLPQETGVLYYAGRVRNTEFGQWYYANNGEWSDASIINAEYSINTIQLPAPDAANAEMLDGTRIALTWEKTLEFENVIVLAKSINEITTAPLQGTAYSVGNLIDEAQVIYKGNANGFIHIGLQNNTLYNYKIFTINNNYYSSGIDATATTDDSEGCTFDLSLGEDINVCGGSSVLISSGLTLSPYGDSLTIIFNSSAFLDFAELTKVYMHSGVEINAGTTWDYTVGNWGEDDGIGLMTDLGGGMWMMKFNPLDYYGYNPASNLLGISLVFRNFDGTIIAQNPENAGDFYIDMSVSPPVSSHNSIITLFQTSNISSILWSTGAQTPSISVSSASEVWVTAMDIFGCVGTDTVNVGLHSLPFVELGLDQTVCSDVEVVLDAGDFNSYLWSDSSDADTLLITSSGNYSVTVSDINGCTGFDVVTINLVDYPVADFSYIVVNGTQVDFTDLSLNGITYAWDFNNDNVTDNTTAGNVSHTYPTMGQYSVKLTVSNDCSSDIETKTIYVLGIDDNQISGLSIYPNPVADILNIEMNNAQEFDITISDISGKIVYKSNSETYSTQLDVSAFAPGLYTISILSNEKNSNHKIIVK